MKGLYGAREPTGKAVQEREDVREMLGSSAGRRFLFRVLEQCGVFKQSFTPGAPDVSVFNEGRRSVGLWLSKVLSDADVHALNNISAEFNAFMKSLEGDDVSGFESSGDGVGSGGW